MIKCSYDDQIPINTMDIMNATYLLKLKGMHAFMKMCMTSNILLQWLQLDNYFKQVTQQSIIKWAIQ